MCPHRRHRYDRRPRWIRRWAVPGPTEAGDKPGRRGGRSRPPPPPDADRIARFSDRPGMGLALSSRPAALCNSDRLVLGPAPRPLRSLGSFRAAVRRGAPRSTGLGHRAAQPPVGGGPKPCTLVASGAPVPRGQGTSDRPWLGNTGSAVAPSGDIAHRASPYPRRGLGRRRSHGDSAAPGVDRPRPARRARSAVPTNNDR
jgi:hypothetical protein